ncbi:MAG TPA: hypothetical protein VF491_16900, partial [Vicinamibacterales bacterium]
FIARVIAVFDIGGNGPAGQWQAVAVLLSFEATAAETTTMEAANLKNHELAGKPLLRTKIAGTRVSRVGTSLT